MNRWFRHYNGMMRDEKLVSVAVKTKKPVHLVVWVWGAILESAAEIDDGGRYEFDAGEAAYFLREDEGDVAAIVDCLTAAGRLAEGRVVKWGDRQYQSDKSASRQAAYRERMRAKESACDVTRGESDGVKPSRDGEVTPQDTETDTEEEVGLGIAGDESEVLEAKLRNAAGWQSRPEPSLFVTGPVMALIASGADLEMDVLPTIRAMAPKCRSPNWKYFLTAIAQARDDRIAASKIVSLPAISGKSNGSRQQKPSRSDTFAAIRARIAAAELAASGDGDGLDGNIIEGKAGY